MLLGTSSSAHPCWLVPCRSHKFSRALQSPQFMTQFVFHLLKEVVTCSCTAGERVLECTDETHRFVSLIWFFYSMPFHLREPAHHLSRLREDTFLLISLGTAIGIPWPWCLWMTVHVTLKAPVAHLFLAGIWQQRRGPTLGQHSVWWLLHSSVRKVWSTTQTVFLLFPFFRPWR